MMKFKIRNTKRRSGPGNNLFLKENVQTTKDGFILSIKDGSCSEVVFDKRGYGIYECEITKPFFLPKGIIFGFFLYKNDQNEVDIELGRWNRFFNFNSQFVIQKPFKLIRLFSLRRKHKLSINWHRDYIEFKLNNKTKRMQYKNEDIGKLHINLWAYGKPKDCSVKVTHTNIYKP